MNRRTRVDLPPNGLGNDIQSLLRIRMNTVFRRSGVPARTTAWPVPTPARSG
ncbi:hypothetical protein ACFSC4_28480 [Deinococcus malanensis]|uniref:hypothetical protein n=1 Tax=Deinococcus malanensis TaxID=1706855 RepID=UPI00363B3903